MRYVFRQHGWPRFVLTTFLIAFAMTALISAQPGEHAAPVVDWIAFGLIVAVIRLVSRYAWRTIRRPRHRDEQ
jgi:hypothetical protein